MPNVKKSKTTAKKPKIKIEKLPVDESVVYKFNPDLMASEMNPQQARFLVSCFEQQKKSRTRPQSQIRSIELTNREIVEAVNACAEDYGKALIQLCEAHDLDVEALHLLATTDENKNTCALSRESIIRAFTAEHKYLTYLYSQQEAIENQMRRAMEVYVKTQRVAVWAMKYNKGFGPIFAMKLLAWLDIEQAPTVGHFYAFGGMDPSREFLGAERARAAVSAATGTVEEIMLKLCAEFGQNLETIRRLATTDKDGNQIELTRASLEKALSRRPYHVGVKTLYHLIAETFMKQSPPAPWRLRYEQIKAEAQQRNLTGGFAPLAARILAKHPNHKQANIYVTGRIPDGHLNNWVLRKLVKQFLIGWHRACYHCRYGVEVPKPYPIAIQGHGHLVAIAGQPAWQEPGTRIDVERWYPAPPTVGSMLNTISDNTAQPTNVDIHGELQSKLLSKRSVRKNFIHQDQASKIAELA
jgi:hypothetical protein